MVKGKTEQTGRSLWLVIGLLCFLYFSPVFSSSPPLQEERLEYRVSYEGILSVMAKIDICDAVLETSLKRNPYNNQPAYRSIIEISSEGYKKMEQVYPFRYRFRSFYSTDLQRSILIDTRKKTRKERHEIVWFDWEQGTAERYKKRKPEETAQHRPNSESEPGSKKDKGMSSILSNLNYDPADFRRSSKQSLKLPDFLLDRLSLLQAVRSKDLNPGQEIRLSISNGKAILNYQVRVLAREQVEESGRAWDTFKLRFDAFKDGRWAGSPAHSSVYIWLTADKSRTPVRFAIGYALGTFVVQIKEENGLQAPFGKGHVALMP